MMSGSGLKPQDEKREFISDIWAKRGATYGEKGGGVRPQNEKREFISDIWGKRGATYGEKGVVSADPQHAAGRGIPSPLRCAPRRTFR